ncbi:MAG: lysylphosphatidylglycerol synthase domain-containing protein, partial [Gemmatimonadota bacterium]
VLTAAWGVGGWGAVAGTAASRAALLAGAAAVVFLIVLLLARLILRGGMGVRPRRWTLRGFAWIRRRFRAAWVDARDVFLVILDRGKAQLALSLLLTAVQWGARYSVITALIAFLGAPVKPLLFWALQWVVFTLMTLMPTPGAAGGAEVTFAIVYGTLLPIGILGVATAGWRFLTFYLQVGLAAVLFPLLGRLARARHTRDATPAR